MAETTVRDWVVTVLDDAGNELCEVSILRDDAFTRVRFYNMIDRLAELEDRIRQEYVPMEFYYKRENRTAEYDRFILDTLEATFPGCNTERLFEQHRPTESVNGRAYALWVLESILRAFGTLLETQKTHTWTQINV